MDYDLITRRRAVALLTGVTALTANTFADAAPVRLAISESLISGVNLNDARAAMRLWLNQMMSDYKLAIEVSDKVFDTPAEITARARNSTLDVVGLNILEYRQIADMLDPNRILAEGQGSGTVQYLLLAKKTPGPANLPDLRGRRLLVFDHSRMCVASAWLTTLLAGAHLGLPEQFFGQLPSEGKASRVVLPVFFGQADACLITKAAFDTICELNPQVQRELTVVATSPLLAAAFSAFHKNYHGSGREIIERIYLSEPRSAAERQLAALFQFRALSVRDIGFLAPTIAILDSADRIRRDRGVAR